jgi:hypothetical protein
MLGHFFYLKFSHITRNSFLQKHALQHKSPVKIVLALACFAEKLYLCRDKGSLKPI